MKKQTLPVVGMMCASCSARVERCLKEQPDVASVAVNLAGRTALVEYDEAQTSLAALQKAVADAGYELIVESDRSVALIEHRAAQLLLRRTVVAWLLALMVMALSMGWIDTEGRDAANQWQLILAAISLGYCGRQFFTTAWKQLLHRSASMDTLVALSTGISFLFSTFNTFWGESFWGAHGMEWYTYFDAATMITAFVLLGRWLEERAKNSTSAAIRALIGLQPKAARLVKDGAYHDVPISTLERGDTIELRPGERVPIDGDVVSGEAFIDASAMTGESALQRLTTGSQAMSGTMVKSGTLQLRATRVGEKTLLQRMIKAVEEAQGSKAPVQKLVDRVALIFVPAVLIIALLTFLLHLFVFHSPFSSLLLYPVSVLVIACPCALGLATPTALMVGIGRAAQQGILIKDAVGLEQLKNVSAMVLDKTGTLTIPRGGIDVTTANHLAPEERESLKPHAAEAIAELKAQGVDIYLMSGDEEEAVSHWAKQAGIDHYKSKILPQDKQNLVAELQQKQHVVAMVGDGVNDSQALATADVSIAMGHGTDVAMNVAQVTLMNDDLLRLPEAIALSRKTVSTIRQNLFWAFIYNVVCIPLAAGLPQLLGINVQITPTLASALMACSSVSVVLNSLRLKWR